MPQSAQFGSRVPKLVKIHWIEGSLSIDYCLFHCHSNYYNQHRSYRRPHSSLHSYLNIRP